MKDLIVLDCEVYPNYFLVAFKNIDTGKIVTIEAKGKDNTLSDSDAIRLRTIMYKRNTFGFNSNNYDMSIILKALRKSSCSEIHRLSDEIINKGLCGWQSRQAHNLILPIEIHHFDIIEPSPGVQVSLKLYGARMHAKHLQDLPIAPGTHLTEQQMEDIKLYCINDLDTTILLYRKIEGRMQLRFDMVKDHGEVVLSKSDAQIAELVIKSQLDSSRAKPPKLRHDTSYEYITPGYISFRSQELKDLLYLIENHRFELDAKGSIKLPKELSSKKIKLGYSTYKIGIGGIHSTESRQSIIPTENQLLVDKDVASYYPSIILNLGLYPKHLGEIFLRIYENIVKRRLIAKKTGDKIVNEALKIVINGSFGKFGNRFSALYSPDLMMKVTLTGQLAILMLIEKLEDAGVNVMSANTDGFVSLMPKDKYDEYERICKAWQTRTKFDLEESRYKALYSRDVNNYLAITDYGHKGKGVFTLSELSKNPQGDISVIAVIDYLTKNIPITKTIRECKDVTKFLLVRSVTGGAVWRGEYLGRVVRWIYSTDGEEIRRNKLKENQSQGDKVAKSDGARPIMTLGEFPSDIDYNKYIKESMDILDGLGLLDF